MSQRLLIFVTWYIASGCSSSDYSAATDYYLIPFRTIGQKIPVIQAILNDKSAWFIVDTGASFTMLNATESAYFGFSVLNSPRQKREISGFSNTLMLSETSFCRIEIGLLKIGHNMYRSVEMNALFATIEKNEKMRIAGILGSDILARYRINVNYDTRTLSYKIRNGTKKNETETYESVN